MSKKFNKIMKDDDNVILCGVLSGFSAYLGIDSFILRLIFVLILISPFDLGGFLILFYIICYFIMPDYDPNFDTTHYKNDNDDEKSQKENENNINKEKTEDTKEKKIEIHIESEDKK